MAKAKKQEETKFDPNAEYQWSTDAKFEVDGTAFGTINQLVHRLLGKEEGNVQETALAVQLMSKLSETLKNAVEAGVAKEKAQELVAEEVK